MCCVLLFVVFLCDLVDFDVFLLCVVEIVGEW